MLVRTTYVVQLHRQPVALADAERASRVLDSGHFRQEKSAPRLSEPLSLFVYGGADEDRTHDLCIANAALSHLSYRPTDLMIIRKIA